MRIYQRLTPLTEKERQFASENHYVIEWFFKITSYDMAEYYDVAAIGYLKAVKAWHAREELHKYSFATIAKKSMAGYIWSEQKKAERRIKTISLNAVKGANDNCSLMDTITYDNYLNCYVGM
ncbi:MAG: hypothetical protein ACRDBO_14650 [Lachnospiraceae bacterium]